MLGGMTGVEAAAIVGFDDLQPFLIECVQRTIVAIEVVETPNFIRPRFEAAHELGIIRESARPNKISRAARR
jgi:hypothetical protein